MLGHWDARADVSLVALIRHLAVYTELRFGLRLDAQYVAAHTGEPGNEIADHLAGRAAQGNPLTDLSDWYDMMNCPHFRDRAAWFWLLYSTQTISWWDGDELCLPGAASTRPPLDIIPCSTGQTDANPMPTRRRVPLT